MPRTKEKNRAYMRRYSAGRALEDKMRPRLEPYIDGNSQVTIRATMHLLAWGTTFLPEHTYKIHWKRAARLVGGLFAEIVKSAPAHADEPRAAQVQVADLKNALRAIDRGISRLTRAAGKEEPI